MIVIPRYRHDVGPTKGTKVHLYFDAPDMDIAGFIGTQESHETKYLIISYRGSASLKNWIENIEFEKKCVPWIFDNNVLVHCGFLDSYLAVRNQVNSQVQELLAQDSHYRLVVTGHSLGGAIATLSAIDLCFVLPPTTKIELMTFESPRVGNAAFAEFAQRHLRKSTRITNQADPVVHLPPYNMEFRHVVQEWFIDFDNVTRECDRNNGEDPTCADSVQLPIDVSSHCFTWDIIYGAPCEPSAL